MKQLRSPMFRTQQFPKKAKTQMMHFSRDTVPLTGLVCSEKEVQRGVNAPPPPAAWHMNQNIVPPSIARHTHHTI